MPFAQDSYTGEYSEGDGHYTENIKSTITQGSSDDQYILDLAVDKDFLENSNTVYPVVVDPTLTYGTLDDVLSDTFVSKKYPDNSYGGDEHVKIGMSDALGKSRGLVNFILTNASGFYSSHPAIINSAYYRAYEDAGYSSAAYHGAFRVLDPWTASVTWNDINNMTNQPFYDGSYIYGNSNGSSGYISVANGTWNSFYITALVQGWIEYYYTGGAKVAGSFQNCGIYLIDRDESDRYRRYRSMNYGSTSTRSTLTINFTTDTVAPTAPTSASLTLLSWQNSTNGTAALSASGATDSDSGIAFYQYSLDGTNFSCIPDNGNISITNTTNAVYVRAMDYGGNVSPATIARFVSAPSRVWIDNEWGWINTNPTVHWENLNAANGTSISQVQYSTDGSHFYPITNLASGNYSNGSSVIYNLPDGGYNLWIEGVNNYGLSGPSSAMSNPIYIDRVAPSAPTSASITPVDWNSTSGIVTVSVSGASDNTGGSGLAGYQYSTTSASSVFVPVPSNGQITISSATTIVYFRAIDNAQNTSSAIPATVQPGSVSNFSVQSNVNYTTALTWAAPVSPTGVKYDVYRSTSQTGTYTAVATDLTTTYWNDYNINYGTNYYYQVKATKVYLGTKLSSAVTTGIQATTPPLNDINKQVGKKDYEQPVSFDTQSGSGNINASGNMLYQTTDCSIASPIGSLSFERSYNSQTTYTTALGTGWDYNYDILLLKEYNTSGSETGVILKLGDGTMYRFTKNTDGTYTRPSGFFATLTLNSGVYSLTFTDKTVYLFNTYNKIQSITDRVGNYINFTYDSATGNLAEAIDNVGSTLDFTYTTVAGKTVIQTVKSCIDIASSNKAYKTYNYSYNTAGWLTGEYITSGSNNVGESYAYTSNELTTITNYKGNNYTIAYTSGKVSGVTNPLNQTMTVSYSSVSPDILVTTVLNYATQKYYYNGTSFVLHETQFESDNPTVYTYDVDVQNAPTHDYLVMGIACPDSHTESYTYNTNGTVDTFVNKTGTAAGTTSYTYGDSNNPDLPTQISEPFNGSDMKVTINTYDTSGKGELMSTHIQGTSPTYPSTSYTYNTFGEKLTEITTVTVGSNTFTNETDYSYTANNESKGRLTTTTKIDSVDGNAVSSQTYDAYGNTDTATDEKGTVTKYYYSILGQQTQVTTQYGTANAASTYATYFTDGKVHTQTDATSDVTTYTYDVLGRQTEKHNPDDTTETTGYEVKSNGYQVTTNTDGSGVQTVTVTDKKGQTVLTGTIGDPSSNTSYQTYYNDHTLTSFTIDTSYDAMGKLLTSSDNSGAVTTNTYDTTGLGRLMSTTVQNGTLDTTTSYTYYDSGLVNTKTDPKNVATTYNYYKTGNPLSESVGTRTTSYTYDQNGNIYTSTLTDSNYPSQSATNTYTYDKQGRKTEVQYSSNERVDYTYYSANNNVEEKLYKNNNIVCTTLKVIDDIGRLTQIDQNNVTIVKYTYDSDGDVLTVQYGGNSTDRTIGYTYDNGKMWKVYDDPNGANTLIREYTYNASTGKLDTIIDHKGSNTANQKFSYDDVGRVQDVKYYANNSTTSVLEEYTLTYNDTGSHPSNNIATETTSTDYNSTPVTTSKSYTYDTLGRLATETSGSVTTSYTYDDAGNRLTMAQGSNTLYYQYNGFDQLTNTATDSGFQNVVTHYGYDLNGNETSMSAGGTTNTYAYDDANWLQSVTQQVGQGNPWTNLASYAYDASGERTQKTVGSDVTNYYYTGTELLYTKDGSGNIIEQNVLETDGSMINSRRSDGNDYWYRLNAQGSVTNIVNSSDSVSKSYTYDAYGNTTSSGTFINSFAYTGAVIDTETGLYYMNARYYDPDTGRFISQDTYRGDGEAFWNLYLYCNGDPVNNTDPTGKASVKLYIKSYVITDIVDGINIVNILQGSGCTIVGAAAVFGTVSVTTGGIAAIVGAAAAAALGISAIVINHYNGKKGEIWTLYYFKAFNIPHFYWLSIARWN